MNSLIITTLEQGLIFSVLALGVFITYKLLDIPDLSVEGTFPFGAFIFIKFLQLGVNPIIATLFAFIFGSFAGLLTATLFIKLKIQPILAGILTMTILYSVNLKVAGQPNISIFNENLIFDLGPKILILIAIVLLVKVLLDLFLKTEIGYLLVATGDNEHLTRSLG
ncbi:MAG TPA: ABC transporter permease, partial [Tissierellaceae bacterium]